jgi:hypothetical protein
MGKGKPMPEQNSTRAELLEYWLREIQVAVRIMMSENSDAHVFNLGTKPDGEMLSCLVLVCSRTEADRYLQALAETAAHSRAPQKASVK